MIHTMHAIHDKLIYSVHHALILLLAKTAGESQLRPVALVCRTLRVYPHVAGNDRGGEDLSIHLTISHMTGLLPRKRLAIGLSVINQLDKSRSVKQQGMPICHPIQSNMTRRTYAYQIDRLQTS
jgi:hypothetical protein